MDSDYPYTSDRNGRETRCAHKYYKTIGKVKDYGQIRTNLGLQGVKDKLKTHPMTIAVDAGNQAFQYYKSGVVSMSDRCGKNLNHAVVLVGYTETDDDTVDPVDPVDPVVSECKVFKLWHSCTGDSRRQLQDSNENYWKIQNYLKIQNSWSNDWGDKGFILFDMAEGDGVCGMKVVRSKLCDWLWHETAHML